MADIAKGVVAKLNAASGVTSLVGSRVYPAYRRQSDAVLPCAVYHIESSPVDAMDGASGLMTGTLEIEAVGRTYGEAVAVGDAIYAALESQAGQWGTVTVQGCFLQDNGLRDDVVTDPSTEEVLGYVKGFAFDLRYSQ